LTGAGGSQKILEDSRESQKIIESSKGSQKGDSGESLTALLSSRVT